MIDADKITNPQHFWSDPADRLINPEIWIGITDHFWLNLDRGSALQHNLVVDVCCYAQRYSVCPDLHFHVFFKRLTLL